MLSFKVRYLGVFLAVLASPALVDQARAGILLEVPVNASNSLIEPAVTAALGSSDLTAMRANVAATTVQLQSTITYDQITGERIPLPMESVLQPLMQETIMGQVVDSLSDPTNPDGAVYLFAPDFVTEDLIQDILPTLPPVPNSTPPPP